jgi:replication factor A1
VEIKFKSKEEIISVLNGENMKIGELKQGSSNVAVEGKIIDIGEPRQVNTRYGSKRVADAVIEDDSGQIKLSLWEDQISKVAIGDTVVISGAYVTAFRDQLQLSIPRSGKLEVADSSKDL